ncbi:hypothetical protein IWT25_02369 [Secundilactobacillus pentosiphilus]|uniref:Phage protein n=1 Tax=Secundilactobacillus pentosiphilus TaxID=1714682 RepID=A0A1Z5IZW7_9LACO|nr:hypothetical protein [Secundilactobacillus pentosiphilus]GAX07021.1 hypothetical protein IWT25_02369 [Secundilactobacillus pentosiphilus]
MEKDAFEYLNNLANSAADKKVQVKNGDTFLIGDDVHPWHHDYSANEPIEVHTLTAIVDYLKSGADNRQPIMINVVSPSKVYVYGPMDGFGEREELMRATLVQDHVMLNQFMDREQLNIMLQAQFEDTPDKKAIIDFISHLKEDKDSSEVVDDGVTQMATVKTGVASVGIAKVPNPVALKPYRTFPEVDQPESQFIFRMAERMQGAIYEADGGMWKNNAIKGIKEYLASAISDKIKILG